MSPELAQLETKVTLLLSGLDARQTQATPSGQPEGWSIQQIVEHLLLSYRLHSVALRERMDGLHAPRHAATFRQRLRRMAVLGAGLFPQGATAEPELIPATPISLRGGEELAARIHVELSRLDTLAFEAESLFGSRPVLAHASFGPLSVQQYRRLHLLHGLHHARQIASIRKERGL